MKRTLLLLACAIGSLTGRAQMSLTYSTHAYPTGSYTAYVAENQTIDTNLVGANVTWDFSDLTVTNSVNIQIDTNDGSAFPDANLVFDNGASLNYYLQDENGLQLVGVNQQGINIIYSDFMKVFEYPFTYQDQFQDSAYGEYTYAGVTYDKKVSVFAEADAYGEAQMSFGYVDDVLRIRQVSQAIDSSTASGVLTISRSVAYVYYGVNFKAPIVQYSVGEVEQLGQIYPFEAIEFLIDSSYYNTVEDNILARAEIKVYPNPTSDFVRVDLGAEIDVVDIEVMDLQGRLVKRRANYYSQDQLDVAELPKGTYIVSLIKDGDRWNKILMIE